MKVRELFQLLRTIDPEREVILSCDSEGNGYYPLSGVDTNSIYLACNKYGEGDVFIETLTDELRGYYGYTQEDVYQGGDGQKAIVLYP